MQAAIINLPNWLPPFPYSINLQAALIISSAVSMITGPHWGLGR